MKSKKFYYDLFDLCIDKFKGAESELVAQIIWQAAPPVVEELWFSMYEVFCENWED